MTAATYTTNLADIFTDGSTSGWTAKGGGASGLNQETDYYIQGTSCLSKNAFASATKGMIYSYGSDAGGSGADGAYLMWVTHLTPNSLDTKAGAGIQMLIGSGTTAYEQYYVGGSDTIEFGGWILAAVNEATAGDATTGSPSATVESYFGALWDLPSGGPTKGAPNGIDAIRFGRCDAIIEYGDVTPNGPAEFDSLVSNLDSVTNRYGLMTQREPGGAFENSGLVLFGTATNAVRFEDSNKTIFLRAHDHVTANFHTWEVRNASSVVNLTNITVQALGTVSRGRWVTTDNATLNWSGCTFTDMGTFGFDTNATIVSTFRRCDAVTHGGADMSGSIIDDTNVAANASALIYNLNVDPDGEMDGMTFTMGATATHAIEFGTAIADGANFTLRDCVFNGYNASNGNNDSTFHFKDTSGSITLNIVGGSGNVSYRTEGVTVTIVQDPVTTSVHVANSAGADVSGARVLLRAADGTGPLPYEESVTITQSAGVATVTHTGHGLATGNYVVITGASPSGYNKQAQITVTGANSYTYAVDSGLSSPATGSPASTGAMISGTTDVNGDIGDTRTLSTDQPVVGYARKSTSAPYYKSGAISGTVDSAAGIAFNIILISDE